MALPTELIEAILLYCSDLAISIQYESILLNLPLRYLHSHKEAYSSRFSSKDFPISSRILSHRRPSFMNFNDCLLVGSKVHEASLSVIAWLARFDGAIFLAQDHLLVKAIAQRGRVRALTLLHEMNCLQHLNSSFLEAAVRARKLEVLDWVDKYLPGHVYSTDVLTAAVATGNVEVLKRGVDRWKWVETLRYDMDKQVSTSPAEKSMLSIFETLDHGRMGQFDKIVQKAIFHNETEAMRFLMDERDRIGFPEPFSFAVYRERRVRDAPSKYLRLGPNLLETVKLLVELGIVPRSLPYFDIAYSAVGLNSVELFQYTLQQASSNLAGWEKILELSAKESRLEMVTMLCQHGIAPTEKSLQNAIISGSLEAMLFLAARYSHFEDIRESGLQWAAVSGNRDVIQLMLDKGCVWTTRAIDIAATNGHFELVDTFGQAVPHSQRGLDGATENGHTDIVDLLIRRGPFLPSKGAFTDAIWNGHHAVIRLIHDFGIPGFKEDSSFMEKACQTGSLGLVRFFNENGYQPCNDDVMHEVFNLLVARHLHENLGFSFTRYNLKCALRNRDSEFIRYYHQTFSSNPLKESDDSFEILNDLMAKAASQGDLEVLRYLYDQGFRNVQEAFECAVEAGFIEIATFLHEREPYITNVVIRGMYGDPALHRDIIIFMLENNLGSWDEIGLMEMAKRGFIWELVAVKEKLFQLGHEKVKTAVLHLCKRFTLDKINSLLGTDFRWNGVY
ncbi:hypothetical protein HDU97_007829 [Phlyctochytrium planicorne]|nr:hypothetical protein HDU97_007829 [Phlyctochytrium planicorne]